MLAENPLSVKHFFFENSGAKALRTGLVAYYDGLAYKQILPISANRGNIALQIIRNGQLKRNKAIGQRNALFKSLSNLKEKPAFDS